MESNKYAYLPEDLILKMLKQAPETAKKISEIIKIDQDILEEAKDILNNAGVILNNDSEDYTESIIAVDGADIIEKKTSSDILMSLAVGVEGLRENESKSWSPSGQQYYQWQTVLPHHVANARLTQGIMFLMELSVLAKANHDIRIMDGTHITMIIKLNSLLSANSDEFADMSYVLALEKFLDDEYEKIIHDI